MQRGPRDAIHIAMTPQCLALALGGAPRRPVRARAAGRGRQAPGSRASAAVWLGGPARSHEARNERDRFRAPLRRVDAARIRFFSPAKAGDPRAAESARGCSRCRVFGISRAREHMLPAWLARTGAGRVWHGHFGHLRPGARSQGVNNLFERMGRMVQSNPTFCDITWGAGGSTADLTMDIATRMQARPPRSIGAPGASRASSPVPPTAHSARASPGAARARQRAQATC